MKKFISLLLVCLMVVPFGMLASTGVSAAAETVYLSDAGDDTKTGADAANAVKTMAKAFELVGNDGGTVIITGTYSHTAKFTAPAHTGKITIKGADANAKFHVTAAQRFLLGGPVVIESLFIDVDNNWSLVCNYNDLTIADTVTMERSGRTGSNPNWDTFIIGGHGGFAATDTAAKDYTLTINGGNWMEVVGAIWKDAADKTTADEKFKDFDATINVGGNAVIAKLLYFSRTSKYLDPAKGSTMTINLNGGKITHFVAAHDNKNEDLGYGNGVTINIGKDFDLANSFNAVTEDKRITGDCYYGISGDSAWVLDTLVDLDKTKLVIAAEIYDDIINNSKLPMNAPSSAPPV